MRFYASLYPDATLPDPLALKMELWRGDERVANVPLQLPPPTEPGETRYVGLLSTKTLKPAADTIRLAVSQGAATTGAEAGFTLVPAAP